MGEITEATLLHMVLKGDWKDSNNDSSYNKPNHQHKNNIIKDALVHERILALEIWERCLPADNTHPYILSKEGMADGLRIYPRNEPSLTILNQNVSGYLVVPCMSNSKIQTLQVIPPNSGKKLNLEGAKLHDGYFVVVK